MGYSTKAHRCYLCGRTDFRMVILPRPTRTRTEPRADYQCRDRTACVQRIQTQNKLRALARAAS